jgi:hypothetical protein
MSSIEFITIDEFDGTHGYVKTKGFVDRVIDLPCHKPRQKVVLGDSSLGDVERPCVVYAEDISLKKGCGYVFGGIDYVYENGEEIQLCLGDSGWANKFYDPAES